MNSITRDEGLQNRPAADNKRSIEQVWQAINDLNSVLSGIQAVINAKTTLAQLLNTINKKNGHSSAMPDVRGENGDHDQRYIKKAQLPNPLPFSGLVAGRVVLTGTGTITDSDKILCDGTYLKLLSDTVKLFFGAGADMTVWYDGTSGQIKTSDVAASDLKITCGAHKTVELQNAVTDDLALPIIPRASGIGRPTLGAVFGGTSLQMYSFAVNDFSEIDATELIHRWQEGTSIEIHCHWATGGTNDGTVRGVKWEVEYSWANTLNNGGQTAFPAVSVQSAETSIAASEPAGTHKYTSIYSFTPTGGKIGAYLALSIKRIASVTNIAPVVNPILLAVGVHISIDTLGSRQQAVK